MDEELNLKIGKPGNKKKNNFFAKSKKSQRSRRAAHGA